MKTISSKWAPVAILVFLVIVVAWMPAGDRQGTYEQSQQDDTSRPRKKTGYRNDISIGDLDQAMRDLDRALADMDKNIKFDFGKMDKEMKQAMEEIKKIDFDKISREISASLKEIDWSKTRMDVDKALREAEVKMKEVDLKKIHEELASAKIHIDGDKIRKSVEEGLSAAKTGIAKAKVKLALMKEFVDALEKDGLIDKKKDFRIRIKDDELYINGVKQSKEVNDKYRKYFDEWDDDFTISSDGEGSVRI